MKCGEGKCGGKTEAAGEKATPEAMAKLFGVSRDAVEAMRAATAQLATIRAM